MRLAAIGVVLLLSAGALISFGQPGNQPHWAIQYQYRDLERSLTINDIAFPSKTRGVACGYSADRDGKERPLVLVTSDGGEHWSETVVRETGVSLSFIDDSTGWMVTDRGIWSTVESGRAWKKLNAPTGMQRVWFVTKVHGFAVGAKKRAFETTDGGETWTLLPIIRELQGDPAYTAFGEIAFRGENGMITGWSTPPVGGASGKEPLRDASGVQVPQLTIILETRDGGKTWTKTEASLFGQITRLSLPAEGPALGLIEFLHVFEYPSEVYGINLHNGHSERVFRQKDRAITSVKIFAADSAYLAGYETAIPYHPTPVPGKLKVLTSDDLTNWDEMQVDYRAVAHRATFAGPDRDHQWIGTDTGTILHLVTE
jgi:hypothetical protein